ncbi:hypothetical protein QQF64_020165 [Cirrhinus molitorella]|uniref:Uncharacterized protein n=1 Tax=Cirrhinus molitorella TaxID=172907 RepID=A0ABR3L9U2_9TELE
MQAKPKLGLRRLRRDTADQRKQASYRLHEGSADAGAQSLHHAFTLHHHSGLPHDACFLVTSSSCQSDRNKDHRPRVSCVSQGLTAVPDAIDTGTQVLVLTGNQFTSLSWSMYSGFTELHELDLSHNHISTLEPPGPVLEKLSVLRLSGNRLTGLGGLVFRGTPNLMEIYLDRNQIRSLHDGTFSELPRLEVIDLSQNKLPALPPRLLERVSSGGLKTFDLENNSVSLMPDRFFSSKPELPYVYLSHNPWLCSCAVSYLHSYLKRPGAQRLHTRRTQRHRSLCRLRGVFRTASPAQTAHH